MLISPLFTTPTGKISVRVNHVSTGQAPAKSSWKSQESPAAAHLSSRTKNIPNNRRYYDITLVANYFAIDLEKARTKNLFLYTIGVEPQPTSVRLRRRAIYCWLQTHNLDAPYATKYHNFLVTSTRIPDHEDTSNFQFCQF
jgi:hypothetical protein